MQLMSKDKSVVLAPVETRIADCERDILEVEKVQEAKAIEMAAINFYLQMKQTYLMKLQAERAANQTKVEE